MEDKPLSKLGIPETTELLLSRKLDSIRRCRICRRKMKVFCRGYGFDIFSEVLVCTFCNRANCVDIGEDHDFSIGYSGNVLAQTDDILTVQAGDELVKVYELYGELHYSTVGEDQIRYHRETTFVNPKLEKLEGAFRDRVAEALLCDPETRNLHDRTLGL